MLLIIKTIFNGNDILIEPINDILPKSHYPYLCF